MGLFAVFRGAEAFVFQYLNETNRIVWHQIEKVALFRMVMSILVIYAIVFTLVGIQNIRKGVRKTFLLCICVAGAVWNWLVFNSDIDHCYLSGANVLR